MKTTHIFGLMMLAVSAMAFTACSDDEPDTSYSVITTGNTELNDFDRWLRANYNEPYNIDFKYRYEDIQGDFDYYLVPARYEDAITMAHLVKYLCIETYNEVAGTDFTCRYFPKMFYSTGEWEWNNNNTFILGTAEGGRKIFLTGLNYLPTHIKNVSSLNHYYIHTIHHEFTHILNQTKSIPADYQLVTGTGYVAGSWNEYPYNSEYLQNGFITAYAQHSYQEDFAEMLSGYITSTAEKWDATLDSAPEASRTALLQKIDIVRDYMLINFDIDIDELRNTIQRRQDDIMAGKIDLSDLSV